MLTDLVRILGPPALFMTFAPGEWSFPLPAGIRHALEIGRCTDVFQLGSLVAIGVNTAMTSIIKGYIHGGTGNKPWQWRSFVLANRFRSGTKCVVSFYIRAELQSGAARNTQGREAWHWHVLSWVHRLEDTWFTHCINATVPNDDPELAWIVEEVQCSTACQDVSLQRTHFSPSGRQYIHVSE